MPEQHQDRYSDPIEARKKAMDYLARREHGRVELLNKLAKFGFDATIAGDAIAQLVDDGLQSDARFIDAFVGSRINQGKGPVKIRADLRERGLNTDMIDAGLIQAGQNWFDLAREVHTKKFGDKPAPDYKAKARQMRFLQSRGFDQEHILAAVSADDE